RAAKIDNIFTLPRLTSVAEYLSPGPCCSRKGRTGPTKVRLCLHLPASGLVLANMDQRRKADDCVVQISPQGYPRPDRTRDDFGCSGSGNPGRCAGVHAAESCLEYPCSEGSPLRP